MKIAINVTPLISAHKMRGIGFYTKNLLEELKKNHDLQIQEFTDINQVTDADLVHFPYFEFFNLSIPFFSTIPTVVTIHDVTPLVFPKFYPSGLKGFISLQLQKLALKSVKSVITDSQSSKKDIYKYLNVAESKITPIYLACSKSFKKVTDKKKLTICSEKYSLPEKFAIFVGNVNWNKNINNATEACIRAGVDIVLLGGGFETKTNLGHPELESYRDFLSKYASHPRVHTLGFVEDEDLVSLINLASVCVFVPYYEGFGMPILEAQACGVPVVASNTSSMPEVAGEGALFVDPYKVGEIAEAIKTILENPAKKEILVKKGFENVSQFSWNKAAAETVQVYKQILLR